MYQPFGPSGAAGARLPTRVTFSLARRHHNLTRYIDVQARPFFDHPVQRAGFVPGVKSVALVSVVPMNGTAR